ncbi:MAG: hypothetical protein ACOYXC_18605 [Candidatus Rifleibacteriota bacterium]
MLNVNIGRTNCRTFALAVVFVLLSMAIAHASVVELTAIGKVESIYRDRITMRIIQLVGSDTQNLPVGPGSWVSFDMPSLPGKSRNRRSDVGYGHIVEAALIGGVATEYEVKEDGTSAQEKEKEDKAPILLWTAQSVVKVKNPNDYLTEKEKEEKKTRKRGKKDRKKDKKPEEPVKVWTQEETIRGTINLREKEKRLYIKEERMGKKDKGLDVTDDSWYEKLKAMHGQKIVVHGVTHRTSVSSGTVEIQNILKVYPK